MRCTPEAEHGPRDPSFSVGWPCISTSMVLHYARQFSRVRVGVSFCRESPWLPVDLLISVVKVKFVHHRSPVGVERWCFKANKRGTSSVFALHFRPRWKRVRPEWLKQSQEALDCCGHLGWWKKENFLSECVQPSPLYSWVPWWVDSIWPKFHRPPLPSSTPNEFSGSSRQCRGVLPGVGRQQQEPGRRADQSSSCS